MNSIDALQSQEQSFYKDLYVENDYWNKPYPNHDELMRAKHILDVVITVANRHYQSQQGSLKILDVGCGRGWLTNILTAYGEPIGIEPVDVLIHHAQTLFPNLTFISGTLDVLLMQSPTPQFDLIIACDVIEHIPYEQQQQFLNQMSSLLTAQGNIVLTTPRGEVFEKWNQAVGGQMQPIEDWLTKDQLEQLAAKNSLTVVEHHVFGQYLKLSLYHRILHKLVRIAGFQNPSVKSQTIYQLVWLQKAS